MATRYDTQFKEEALRLVEEVGMTKAADQLGVSPWTIREWRKKKEAYGEQAYVGSGHKRVPPNEKDRIIAEQQKKESASSRRRDAQSIQIHKTRG